MFPPYISTLALCRFIPFTFPVIFPPFTTTDEFPSGGIGYSPIPNLPSVVTIELGLTSKSPLHTAIPILSSPVPMNVPPFTFKDASYATAPQTPPLNVPPLTVVLPPACETRASSPPINVPPLISKLPFIFTIPS